jgi:hypothetical protein
MSVGNRAVASTRPYASIYAAFSLNDIAIDRVWDLSTPGPPIQSMANAINQMS